MTEFTLEQKKAIAIANARRRKEEAANQEPIEHSLTEKAFDVMTPYWARSYLNKKVDKREKAEMFSNLPSSAKNLATGVYDMVTNPMQTVKGLQSIGKGLVDKAIPGDYSTKESKLVDNIGGQLKDRYWGLENLNNTAKNDPAGMLLDMSALGTGGATLTAGGLKAASKLIPESMPVKMMEKAAVMRPTINKYNPNNKREIANTIVKEQINPTSANGLDKAYLNINQLNSKVDEIIKGVPNNVRIKKADLLSGVEDVRKQFTGVTFKGKKNKQAIDKALKDFDDHLIAIKKKDNFTVQEVQSLKKELYEELENAFKKSDFSGAETELMRNIANKAKTSIENIAPGVKETNARLSKHYQMMEELPTIANKMENYRGVGSDMFNKTMTGMAVGGTTMSPFGYVPAAIGSGIGSTIGMGSGLLAHPRVRANNALMLEKLRNSGGAANNLFNKQKIPLMMQGAVYSGQVN